MYYFVLLFVFCFSDLGLRLRVCFSWGMVLQAMVGAFIHFDFKFSELPYSALRCVANGWDETEREEVREQMATRLPCNLPIYIRHFRHLFPTAADMASPQAASTLRIMGNGKRLHSLASEIGHSGERRGLSAANAPGQAWHHHVRFDVCQSMRLDHLRRGGKDLLNPKAAEKKKSCSLRRCPFAVPS